MCLCSLNSFNLGLCYTRLGLCGILLIVAITNFHYQRKDPQYLFCCLFLHPFTARPGFEKDEGCSSAKKSYLEPVPTTENGLLPPSFVLEDPDSHFIYVCRKTDETELIFTPTH